MESNILIAGFGGQGILLMGQLLGYAATRAGLQATYYPFYGPEQRGGTASCTVVVSDDEIGSPVIQKIDILIAMNQPSFVKFMPWRIPGGLLIVNSSLVKISAEMKDARVYHVPATEIAQEIGFEKASNLVMFGALIGITGMLPDDLVCHAIEEKLAGKKESLGLNLLAYRKGIKEIQR